MQIRKPSHQENLLRRLLIRTLGIHEYLACRDTLPSHVSWPHISPEITSLVPTKTVDQGASMWVTMALRTATKGTSSPNAVLS